MRLTRAMIYVKDIRRMAAFYGDTLGLQPIEETRQDTWVEFEAGDVKLALHSIPPQIADQLEISSPPQPREENPVKLIFEVEDLPAERERLGALGVMLIERSWGGWDGMDPEGNIFHISARSK